MNQTAQAGSIAQWNGRGRVYVESISGVTASVRFDANQGRRSRVYRAPVSELDFTAPGGWKRMPS